MRQKLPVNFEYETQRLILKILTPDALHEVLAFQIRNKEAFEAYEPRRPENFYTLTYQQTLLRSELSLALKTDTIRFYVFRKEDRRHIIGTVCLHDIRRGAYSCTEIGYKFDTAWQHMGYAREAVVKVMDIAFSCIGVHRIFARVMPDNAASIRLLEAVGFFYEGTEYRSIEIQGVWQDHRRYAYLCPFPQ